MSQFHEEMRQHLSTIRDVVQILYDLTDSMLDLLDEQEPAAHVPEIEHTTDAHQSW